MIAEFHFESGSIRVDLDQGIDLSDPFTDQGVGPLAWGVDHPRFTAVKSGDFVGSVKGGGPVNFRDLFLNPHGNGTHTECLGHITETVHSVNEQPRPSFHKALLLNVAPSEQRTDESPREKGDAVIHKEGIEKALDRHEGITALILRTYPYPGRRPRTYSGSNPPYFDPEVMDLLREKGVVHLLTDLPSVDKENDGGLLPAHHAFWKVPEEPDRDRTITELIRVPEETPEGVYLLDLRVAPVENDAAPSRPLIFPPLE
jgi:kynurenine formamidase